MVVVGGTVPKVLQRNALCAGMALRDTAATTNIGCSCRLCIHGELHLRRAGRMQRARRARGLLRGG